MATLPTIRIKHPDVAGGIVINKADFKPGEHEPFDPPEVLAKQESADALAAITAKREARRKELTRLSAKDVHAAYTARFSGGTKAQEIDALLDLEFGAEPVVTEPAQPSAVPPAPDAKESPSA